jgi:hypothetical protein
MPCNGYFFLALDYQSTQVIAETSIVLAYRKVDIGREFSTDHGYLYF